jgi:2-phosphosulfolactate phosphatase
VSNGPTLEFSYVNINDCSSIGDEVAVVIDVIRAFSFTAYALDAGVERVILMDDLDATVALADSLPNALAGKDGAPDPRFDLFNSPGQVLERSDLGGRTVVHKTTAGTVGVFASRHVPHLFCASFVVAEATVQKVRLLEPSAVTFVITGDDGRAEEDLACADYIAARLSGTDVDPAPFLSRVEVAGQRLLRGVELGFKGVHADDLALCMDLDRFDFALRVSDEDGQLVVTRD